MSRTPQYIRTVYIILQKAARFAKTIWYVACESTRVELCVFLGNFKSCEPETQLMSQVASQDMVDVSNGKGEHSSYSTPIHGTTRIKFQERRHRLSLKRSMGLQVAGCCDWLQGFLHSESLTSHMFKRVQKVFKTT